VKKMENKTFTCSETKHICVDFDNFMLKKPEPSKFAVHKLGVKGTMRRTEIYGNEQGDAENE